MTKILRSDRLKSHHEAAYAPIIGNRSPTYAERVCCALDRVSSRTCLNHRGRMMSVSAGSLLVRNPGAVRVVLSTFVPLHGNVFARAEQQVSLARRRHPAEEPGPQSAACPESSD